MTDAIAEDSGTAHAQLCDRCRVASEQELNNDLPYRVQQFYDQFHPGNLQAVLTPNHLEGMSLREYWCLLDRGCRVLLNDDSPVRSIKWHAFSHPARIAQRLSYFRIGGYGVAAIVVGAIAWNGGSGWGAASMVWLSGLHAITSVLRVWVAATHDWYYSDPRPQREECEWHFRSYSNDFAVSCLVQVLCVGGQLICYSNALSDSAKRLVYRTSLVGTGCSVLWFWSLAGPVSSVVSAGRRNDPEWIPWFNPERDLHHQLLKGSFRRMLPDSVSLCSWLNSQPVAVGDLITRFAPSLTFDAFMEATEARRRLAAHFLHGLSQAKGFHRMWMALGQPPTADPVFRQLRLLWGVCRGIQYQRDEHHFQDLFPMDEDFPLTSILEEDVAEDSFCTQDDFADRVLDDLRRFNAWNNELNNGRDEAFTRVLEEILGRTDAQASIDRANNWARTWSDMLTES